MNPKQLAVFIVAALFIILGLWLIAEKNAGVSENDAGIYADTATDSIHSEPTGQPRTVPGNQVSASDQPPAEENPANVSPVATSTMPDIPGGLQEFVLSQGQADQLIESIQTRYGQLFTSLNLDDSATEDLVNLMIGVLKKEVFLGQLVEEGAISQEAFRRLSTTTQDMTMALSSFLTEEEMAIYDEFLEGTEQRFLNRFENIMFAQISSFLPGLSDLLKSYVSGIIIEELGQLRSGEGGVLSNEHIRTAYARTANRIEQEGRLNELDLDLIQDYLLSQEQSLE